MFIVQLKMCMMCDISAYNYLSIHVSLTITNYHYILSYCRPGYMHFWQLKTFWHATTVSIST